jgi:hypothetical protein
MDDSPRKQAEALFALGKTGTEAARTVGIRDDLGRRWRREWSQRPSQTPPDTNAVRDMELAALRQQVKNAAPQLTVHTYEEEPFHAKELWDRYEVSNARKIDKALNHSQFKIKMDSSEPIGIAFVSDQHVSGDNCIDLKQMRLDAEFIAQTPRIYAILGGDGIDNHIKHRAATIAARTQPDDQLQMFDYYLQILSEKIAVMISGNHDHWTNQLAGVDVIRWLADKNKIRYSPHSAYIEWTVGRVLYRICIAHQYRFNSAMNQTHSPKQMLNFGEHDFDIGVVCHHHEPAQETFYRRGLTRWVARPGAYQVHSDYSAQYGYPTTHPTCPTVVLFPDSRKIIGFTDVREAAHYMRVT